MRPDRATRKKVYKAAYREMKRYEDCYDSHYICHKIKDELRLHFPEITEYNSDFNSIDFMNQLSNGYWHGYWPELVFCAPFDWDFCSAFSASEGEINNDYSLNFSTNVKWKMTILEFMIAMCESDDLQP